MNAVRVAAGGNRQILDAVLDGLADGSAFAVAPPGLTPTVTELEAGELLVFTSGSTGRGIRRTHRSWLASLEPLTDVIVGTPEDRIWIPGPLHSTLYLYGAIHAIHLTGQVILDDEPSDNATIVHAVPARALQILDHPPPRLRTIVVAGDHVPATLRSRAVDLGIAVVEYYGATELSFVAWCRDDSGLRPFPGVEIEIRDGSIWARSPYLATGYLNPPGVPSGPARWRDGWATVGDQGELIDGQLVVRGRGDQAITVGGHTIVVEDVEKHLRVALGVEDVAVTSIDHVGLGAVIVAVTSCDIDEHARREAAQQLVEPARPRRWVRVDALPRTRSGKLDRQALREIADNT